ncbi:hypothetical protein Poli38472_005933 [Pythium oligandrum]|uniref:Uncharacterized protein n=1 Tax=Pythium oligandrum TaxID=41045 RepID=A0A8K1CTM8_PYTOL|nr:hypothetical protein Poli38472_005933 [Pythium oligandrum]|eukprot:TMW68465.1 hypothetical protein Poli38472_005933 [Pythium oligandrum]
MSADTSVDDAMLAGESTGVSSDATATVIESTEICMADSTGNEALSFGAEDPEAFNLPFDALSGPNQQESLYETTLAFTTDAEMSKMLEAASEKADDAFKSAIQQEEKTDSPSMQAAKKQGASTPATEPANARKTGSAGTKRSKSGSQQQTFSWNDILRVQNLIESCLQKYLTKNDIITTLQNQAKIDPSFTAVVWQKLEEQNPKFFHAYKLQLQLRDQISTFNYLVAQHKDMMAKASGNPAVLSSLSMDARGPTRHSSTTAGNAWTARDPRFPRVHR